MSTIRDNIARVRERIEDAARRAGRAAEEVTVVAVTKTFEADMVDAVIEAGITDVGENRIQEFLGKAEAVTHRCRWHLVGHLQRNKATKAVDRFHLVHSIDSVRIAKTLDRLGGERGVVTRGLLEVNTSSEPSKHGFTVDEAVAAASEVGSLAHIDLSGMMTIGPASVDLGETRSCFRELFNLREKARVSTGLTLPELSMGMSADFEIAIEEGATIIRLGTLITGPRSR